MVAADPRGAGNLFELVDDPIAEVLSDRAAAVRNPRQETTLAREQQGTESGLGDFVPSRTAPVLPPAGEIPGGSSERVMTEQQFVEKFFPQFTQVRNMAAKDLAGVKGAYQNYLEAFRTGSRDEHRKRSSAMQEEGLKLDRFGREMEKYRAEVHQDDRLQKAKTALEKLSGTKEFKTFESMIVSDMQSTDPAEWPQHPRISKWMQMKGMASATGAAVESSKDIKARLLANAERVDTPEAWRLYALATSPAAAIKQFETSKSKRGSGAQSKGQLEAGLLQDKFAEEPGMSTDEKLQTVRGKSAGMTGTQFDKELLGEMGYGGMIRQAGQLQKDDDIVGFAELLERAEGVNLVASPEQKDKLMEVLKKFAPSIDDIIERGRKFTDKNGKRHGSGELTEDQVESLLKVYTEDERKAWAQKSRGK